MQLVFHYDICGSALCKYTPLIGQLKPRDHASYCGVISVHMIEQADIDHSDSLPPSRGEILVTKKCELPYMSRAPL